MRLKYFTGKGGFTFIELIVVISILSLLSVIAIADYGLATEKARLQISTESLVASFDEAKVKAESDGRHCFGVWVGKDREPELWEMTWNVASQSCDFDGLKEVTHPLQWSGKVGFEAMKWSAISPPNYTPISQGSLDQLLMLFEPPNGILSLVDPDSRKSLTSEGAYQVCMEFVYDRSDNPIMKKAINVVPITSSFDILGACSL